MALRPLDLMEPEETVGNLWHDYASGLAAAPVFADAAVRLSDLRGSLAVLFRALGGAGGCEIVAAVAEPVQARRSLARVLVSDREMMQIASFDGERLRLPEDIALFPDRDLNRAAYFWLTALAALSDPDALAVVPDPERDALGFDVAQIALNGGAADRVYEACPGLRAAYARLCATCLAMRPKAVACRDVEQAICNQLSGLRAGCDVVGVRQYQPFAPVPIWLRFQAAGFGDKAAPATEPAVCCAVCCYDHAQEGISQGSRTGGSQGQFYHSSV